MSELLVDEPAKAKRTAPTLVLAHGAGAPMDHPWMDKVSADLVERGVRVVRFEFPYMHGRRVDGKKRGPDRAPVLEQTWREVIEQVQDELSVKPASLFIGGKSMGGRIASMVADDAGVKGVVCLGYPFHPPGKPDKTRTAHLENMKTPTLVVQGTRDSMGKREEVEGYALAKTIRVHFIEDGDHGLKPRKKTTGRTEDEALAEACDEVAAFLTGEPP